MKIGIDIDETLVETYKEIDKYIKKYNPGLTYENEKYLTDKEVNAFLLKHIYDIHYTNLYGGELAIREMPIIDKYEDIKQDIIDWGECNIQETDYNPKYSCFQPENYL